jgi:hypothetical protein
MRRGGRGTDVKRFVAIVRFRDALAFGLHLLAERIVGLLLLFPFLEVERE